MAGKGDWRRPGDERQYEDNYSRIFRKQNKFKIMLKSAWQRAVKYLCKIRFKT